MHQSNGTSQEVISMEEYLMKRQVIRAEEQKRSTKAAVRVKEKSSALVMAELYV